LRLLPGDADIEVGAVKTQLTEGELVTVSINIINNYQPFQGALAVEFELPTLLDTITKTETQLILIPVGETTVEFEIPTDDFLKELKVKPRIDLLMKGSEFTALNGHCYENPNTKFRDLSQCDHVRLASLVDGELVVDIAQKPIIVDCRTEGCPGTSECSKANESYVCIQEVEVLATCGQLGCSEGSACNLDSGVCETVIVETELITETEVILEVQEVEVVKLETEVIEETVIVTETEIVELSKPIKVTTEDSKRSLPSWLWVVIGLIVGYFIIEVGPRRGFIRRK
jgi:hypothetical protein